MTNSERLGTRAKLNRASHADGKIYASEDIYHLEVETYFMRDWLFVGRVEELSSPGDYMTMRIVGEPVIIARDKIGVLSAFFNM